MARTKRNQKHLPLVESLADALDEDDDTDPCTVCAL